MAIKYPEIRVKLTGHDGNAFAIIGRVVTALRQAKVSRDEVNQFQNECMSGDYNHLLVTCMEWVNVA